ncbi:MAG: SIMPL domain-containing protein [Actinomycetales bacterium]|nr:SIMPL domain-containing protein [Actinomycetales bacterium]
MADPVGVTTTGTGRVAVQPDVVVARLAAQVTGPQAAAAHHAAARASRGMVDALRARGVARTDLRTSTSSWTDRGEEVTEGRRSVTRLPRTTVTMVVEARLRDLADAGEAIDAALVAGGEPARVESTSWQVSDPGAARVEARAAAFADAVGAARQLAELAGRPLGPVFEVSEAGPAGPGPVRARAMSAASVPLEGGEQEVVVELVVRHGWGDAYDVAPVSR